MLVSFMYSEERELGADAAYWQYASPADMSSDNAVRKNNKHEMIGVMLYNR